MALTLEDLDRRVTALEKAESEKNIVRAVTGDCCRIGRFAERVSASERRMVDVLNERFDQVMVALDRLKTT